MPTIPERLETATAQAELASTKLHQIVNGASNASDVVTEGGNVKPVAKVIANAEAELSAAVGDLEETASAAASAASASASAASSSASAASASASAASGHASTASSGASTATTQAGIATTQAEIATTKAGEASTSATAAQTARTGAETARNAAESARDAAQSSQSAAEAARDLAQSYRDAASGHKDAAAASASAADADRVSAEAAQAAAEAARDLAQTYRDTASGHKDAAAASASTASGHASTADSHRIAAANSASAALASQNAASSSASTADSHRIAAAASASAALASQSAAATSATTALNAIASTFKGGVAGGSVPATSTAAGDYYRVTSAGTSQSKTWATGDLAIYNGTSGNWTQISGNVTDPASLANKTNALAPRGGVYFDGTSGNRIFASLTGQDIATDDFSVVSVVTVPQSLPSSQNMLLWLGQSTAGWTQATAGRFNVALVHHANDALRVDIIDSAFAITVIYTVNNFRATYGAGRTVIVAFNRTGFYINGTLVASPATTFNHSINSSVLGCGVNNTNGASASGVKINSVSLYNTALAQSDITEIFELGGGVPERFKWGHQQALTSAQDRTFDGAGTGNWSVPFGGVTVANNANALDLTLGSSGGTGIRNSAGSAYVAPLGGPRSYRLSFTHQCIAGTPMGLRVGIGGDNGAGSQPDFTPTGSPQTFSAVIPYSLGTNPVVGGGLTFYANANSNGSTYRFDNISMQWLGAVVHLPFNEGAGLTARDQSTNNLHATLTATGVSWVQPNKSVVSTGPIVTTDTTASTNTTSGSIVTSGGIGVAGAVNAGGNIVSGGRVTSTVSGTTNLDFFQANNTTGRMLDVGTNAGGNAYITLRNSSAVAQLSLTGDGSITGGASGLTLNAGGTNQNITLTPSGTGRTNINVAADVGPGLFIDSGTLTANGSSVSAVIGDNLSSGQSIVIGTRRQSGGTYQSFIESWAGGANLTLMQNGGNVLIGTTTQDGNTARLHLVTPAVNGNAYALHLRNPDANNTHAVSIGMSAESTLGGSALSEIRALRTSVANGHHDLIFSSWNGSALEERFRVRGGATGAGGATVTSITASTSTTTGALVVSGGVGVAGGLNAGGTIATSVAGDGFTGYDYTGNATGATAYNHIAAFKSRPTYSGSNTMAELRGFQSSPTHSGAGTVTSGKQIILTSTGGAGPLTNDFGIYSDMGNTRATSNFFIYHAGLAPSLFSGQIRTSITENANGATNSSGHISMQGYGASQKQFQLGYNTTGNYGWMQAGNYGTAWSPILMNANGGNVLIGTTTDNGERLQVNGSALFGGVGNVASRVAINAASDTVPVIGLGAANFGWGFLERLTEGDLVLNRRVSGVASDVMRFTRADGRIALSSTTASTSTSTGALTVAGGLGVAGAGYFGSEVRASRLGLGSNGQTYRVVDAFTNVTASGGEASTFAATNALTTAANNDVLAAFNAASAYSNAGGFGNVATASFYAPSKTYAGAFGYGLFIGNVSGASSNFAIRTLAGRVSFEDTTASTSTTTGALVVSGGVGVAGRITAGGQVGSSGPTGFYIGDLTGAWRVGVGVLTGNTFEFFNSGNGYAPIRASEGQFTTSLRVNTTNGTAVDLIASATATLDFPSISAGGQQDLTVTVTGASVGDVVQLGLPAAPDAGVVFNAFVSAANTVTVRATNVTGSPIDPASATYRVAVMSF